MKATKDNKISDQTLREVWGAIMCIAAVAIGIGAMFGNHIHFYTAVVLFFLGLETANNDDKRKDNDQR